jgi:hypothetical protein
MAAGDWEPGTKIVMLDLSLIFDHTVANTPISVRAGYRIQMPSGTVLQEVRTFSTELTSDQATNLGGSISALHDIVAAFEGVS